MLKKINNNIVSIMLKYFREMKIEAAKEICSHYGKLFTTGGCRRNNSNLDNYLIAVKMRMTEINQ
jgi:hypothetical protein